MEKKKTKMTLETWGMTYSVEWPDSELETDDVLGIAVKLLLAAGYSLDNIKAAMEGYD